MTYAAFRDTIKEKLTLTPRGMTWQELRQELDLPYKRPCPEWIKHLERDIKLSRIKATEGDRALVWRLGA